MEYNLTTEDFGPRLQHAFESLMSQNQVVRQVTGAMGAEFKLMCIENLGQTGTDRPITWKELSKPYAHRVGRPYATLHETGKLMRSIRMQTFDTHTSVFVDPEDCEYAAYHQFGEGKMPSRPFFPINSDETLTPMAVERVTDAAQTMLNRLFEGDLVGPIY